MSTRSTPSASISDVDSIEKEALTTMLDRYLASPPTITEKLAILQTPKKIVKTDKDDRAEAKEFLCKWQAGWEKSD
ncbi:hypothetical protein V8E51_017303 [Hyaloscypha variabilis]|uniref:Uncharacterized protein n=1 Tax=Hyaloscypha variabilis (strain UAMH 11265 / GT02V1 / F) TaxID=1149755 RepID=A0A2J6RHK2_HYAVF|nr:hypothetical protein L207DRAFT_635411 [Hyaloscypha variabilis F]